MGCSSCNNEFNISSSVYNRKKSNKEIKFSCSPSGATLSVLEGSRAKSKIELCDLSFPYEHFFHTSVYLEPETTLRDIMHPLGDKVTFAAFKVSYSDERTATCCTKSEENTITYIFETAPSEERHIKDFMVLTGSKDNAIPKILLSNPDIHYAANVEVILATSEIIYSETVLPEIETETTISNLTINDISSNAEFIYAKDFNIRWIDVTTDNVLGLERNGKILTLDDYVQGVINLSFQTQYMADQVYSLLLWAFYDTSNNTIDENPNDDEKPIIHYSDNFTLSIPLDNFPPAGTDGTNGNMYEGTNGGNIIYLDDLFEFLVDDITDNRDILTYTSDVLQIRPIESTSYVDEIVEVGKYFIEFKISDNANNTLYESYILDVNADSYYYNAQPYKIITEPDIYDSLTIDFSTSGKYYLLIDEYPIEYGMESTSFVFDNENIIEKLVFDTEDTRLYDGRTIHYDGSEQLIVRKD